MFNDVNGAAFAVTVQPYGEGLAVFIEHASFNGGVPFPVTGCTATPGVFDSARAWAEQFQLELPSALTDLNGVRHERV